MKLLSIITARTIWLADVNDFNPRGRKLDRLLWPFLLESYKFKTYPDPRKVIDLSKEGLVFAAGETKNADGEFINVSLSIFNFGIVAETASSTTDSDNFLEVLATQLNENFNLPDYKNIVRMKNYFSQLYVTTDKSLELLNPKLSAISQYLSENVSWFRTPNYQLSRISFWADPVNAITPTPFTLERQASQQFSQNRYFSAAQLQTEKHLELLDKLEAILS